MKNEKYSHITQLVKSKQVNSKLELSKDKKGATYKFSGNKLEDIINQPSELKKIVGFFSDLQFSLELRTNKIIPIEIKLDLNQTRQEYQIYYDTTSKPMFEKLHQLTNKKQHYFDLCFYTLLKYKSADYIGFPGFEFFENKEFINQYIKEFKENIILKVRNKF
jgi:hypothetical protein